MLSPKNTQPYIRGRNDTRSIDSNDPIQGPVPNCSIIAWLKAVAVDNPTAIRKMITSKKDGTYDVTLYQNGKPVIVNVSVKELSLANGAKLSGDTVNNRQEIWPNIIEKAIFKLQGGTSTLNMPTASYLATVTGAKVNSQFTSNLSSGQISSMLTGAIKAGNPIVAGTPKDFGGKGTFTVGTDGTKNWSIGTSVGTVYGNHAYTVKSVDAKKGTVTLQNPWGSNDLIDLPISEFKQVFQVFHTGLMHNQSNLQASNPEAQKIVTAGYGQSNISTDNKVENPNAQDTSDKVQNTDNTTQQISDKIYNSLLGQGKNRVEITAYLLENFSVDLAKQVLKSSDPIIKSLSTEEQKSSEAEQLIKSAQNSANKQSSLGQTVQTP